MTRREFFDKNPKNTYNLTDYQKNYDDTFFSLYADKLNINGKEISVDKPGNTVLIEKINNKLKIEETGDLLPFDMMQRVLLKQ